MRFNYASAHLNSSRYWIVSTVNFVLFFRGANVPPKQVPSRYLAEPPSLRPELSPRLLQRNANNPEYFTSPIPECICGVARRLRHSAVEIELEMSDYLFTATAFISSLYIHYMYGAATNHYFLLWINRSIIFWLNGSVV